MQNKLKFLLLVFLLIQFRSFAQVKEQSGWLASFNSVKLSDKFGLHFDLQFRSADDLDYLKHLLVRPGLTYFINSNQNVTAGYAWIGTFANPDIAEASNLTEHRIWEQYILNYKIRKVPVTHRFRLEQRFIERPVDDLFSQRFRYFVRGIIPVKKNTEAFTRGAFVALQNEVFLHLQNKDQLNKSTFDQNRAYVALGYRLSKKVDLEAGYLNHYSNGLQTNITNHVGQVAVYARF